MWRWLRRIEGGEGAEEGGERRLRNGLLVSLQPPPARKIQFSTDKDSFNQRNTITYSTASSDRMRHAFKQGLHEVATETEAMLRFDRVEVSFLQD